MMDANGYRKITRRKGACVNCRQRKVRCDGAPTCSQCIKLNLKCGYSSNTNKNEKPQQNTIETETAQSKSTNNGNRHDLTGFAFSPSQCVNGMDLGSYVVGSAVGTGLEFQVPAVEGTQVFTPEFSDSVSSWASGQASGEDDHPLDHSIDLGDQSQQNRIWPETLYKDFSSFAPIRFIGQLTGDASASDRDEDLQCRIWNKVRGSRRVDETHARLPHGTLPSYAQPETLEFIDLFFQEHYNYPMFVSKQLIVEILMEAMQASHQTDQTTLVLLNSILAIGCRNSLRKHRMNTEKRLPVSHMRPVQYFECALGHRNALSGGPPSMLKLQALVSMILFLHRGDNAALTRALLSQAITMISDLSLTTQSMGSIHNLSASSEELERMFWLLYSIEKPHALRFGSHSVVDDDLLVYHAPSKRRSGSTLFDQAVTDYSGWEIVNYRYARLCSVIVKTLYSHASLRMTASDVTAAIGRLSGMLEAWRLSIPVAYRPDKDLEGPECHEHAGDAIIRSDISLRYAEASFAIHRWILATSRCGPQLAPVHASSMDQCVIVAKRVLGAAHSCRTDSGTDWPVVMLPALSAMILYILMRRGQVPDCLSYLGIASGFFGKLSVKAESDPDLFAEMSELFLAAHPKTPGQYQTPPQSMRNSVEGDSMSMQMEHKEICEAGTGESGCFDFPEISESSIFDLTNLDDFMMAT